MSANNGDKSRFGRMRKRKLSRRVRTRELVKKGRDAKATAGKVG